MTNKERDEIYEVVWSGGEGLTSNRETKFLGVWTAPPRLYNKTGKHSKKAKTQVVEPTLINPLEED
jgi:hypothetical protein